MIEPKAWHCPNCNAYHAPHVDTCPRPAIKTAFVQEMNTSAGVNRYDDLLRTQLAAQSLTHRDLGGAT